MQRYRVMKKSIALLAWNDGQASQRRVTALRQTQAARMLQEDLAPSHTAYGMAAPAALHAQPKSPENSGRGCVLRPLCTGASRKHPPSKQTTGKRSRRSTSVQWAWLDLNQRPHPYQLNAGNRCAHRRFPRSCATVRAEGMRSNGPLVCVLPAADARLTSPPEVCALPSHISLVCAGRSAMLSRHLQTSSWVLAGPLSKPIAPISSSTSYL
jgi:hypothetical protein